jgi:4-hydroxy-3-methylbut-2-en-1-yl diphosphate synthase IspG/GcpE
MRWPGRASVEPAGTAHLTGVKMAVMSCIVIGPGGLAEADFGYVGGAPGNVKLFKGKECVERAVRTELAVDKLVALLQREGAWREPESRRISESASRRRREIAVKKRPLLHLSN